MNPTKALLLTCFVTIFAWQTPAGAASSADYFEYMCSFSRYEQVHKMILRVSRSQGQPEVRLDGWSFRRKVTMASQSAAGGAYLIHQQQQLSIFRQQYAGLYLYKELLSGELAGLLELRQQGDSAQTIQLQCRLQPYSRN